MGNIFLDQIVQWLEDDSDKRFYSAAAGCDDANDCCAEIKAVVQYMISVDNGYASNTVTKYILNIIGARNKYATCFKNRLQVWSDAPIEACDAQQVKYDVIEQYERYIKRFVENVLINDPNDPHYSAITCRNCIQLLLKYNETNSKDEKSMTFGEYLQGVISEDKLKVFLRNLNDEVTRCGDRVFPT